MKDKKLKIAVAVVFLYSLISLYSGMTNIHVYPLLGYVKLIGALITSFIGVLFVSKLTRK